MTASLILGGKKHGKGSLWQGGVEDTAPYLVRTAQYDTIVFTAMEFQPTEMEVGMLSPVEVLAHPFDDCPLTLEHLRDAIHLAGRVARRVAQGKHVLVTCAMGWNRSGLVTALACHRLTGLSGDQIVRRVRVKRGVRALSNESFANAVRTLPKARRVPYAELSNYISVSPTP